MLCALNSLAYVKDQRLNKLKMRARRFELMEKFYSRWKEKVQHRAEEKIEETGKEVKLALSTSLIHRSGNKFAPMRSDLSGIIRAL